MNLSQSILEEALELARSCNYEKGHSHQVTRLALRLFDELKALHNFGEEERFLLEAAGLLHDIGWIKGRQAHHKTARDLIMDSPFLSFHDEQRVVVALVARYHRRALPQEGHKYYSNLSSENKNKVCVLAALLRVADGLDRSHMGLVQDLSCDILSESIILKMKADKMPRLEVETGKEKSDLFEQVFKRELVIQWFSN